MKLFSGATLGAMLVFAAFTLGVYAADQPAVLSVKEKIAKKLSISTDSIRPSAADGIYEVQHEHDFGYVTADGKYLFQGDMVNLETGEHITEQRRRNDRLAALDDLGDQNMIAFAPPAPATPKYVVTVFTDIDCPYCRKMHSQIDQYIAKGIELRYAFFPRAGLESSSYDKAVSVWCSSDRKAAFTRAKHGDSVPAKKCENPVAREYKLGTELGIRGTPMLILPSGEVYPGYLPPDDLQVLLEQNAGESRTASIDAR